MVLRDLLQPKHAALQEAAVLRGITLVVALACGVFALAVPLVYFILQHAHVESDLRVEAVARARALDVLIRREPDGWWMRKAELAASLEDRVLEKRDVESRVVDAQGQVLATSSFLAPPPQIVQRAPLQKGAATVGYVEVVGTLYPLLLETALVASLGALLGMALFGLMKNVPLNALKRAMDQLREETARAEQANAAKSAFLANMSHEIRTPMNGVIGMTGLLLGTPLSREQQEYVETIRTSGNTLLTVINDVLDFSKMESGTTQLETQPFEVSRCIEDVFSIVATAAQKKGLELLYLLENDVPLWIEGDVTRLRQVLVNLVNNGVKFTEHGEIYVHVSHRAVENGRHELKFAVRDTGIGIPAAAQTALFKPFSQVDAGAARKYEGTGLGLAICTRLVALMGGAITVASEPGKGSTFTFTITADAAQPVQQDRVPDRFALEGKRVLLVDDNETILSILSSVMRRWGLASHGVSSPEEALKLLRGDAVFDLAIVDYHMPGMDGLALALEIRKIAKLPLVLFTSVTDASGSHPQIESLFAAKLVKPLRQSQLFETLNGLFGGQAAPVQTAPRRVVEAAEREARSRLKMLVAEDNPVNMRLVSVMLDKLGYRADMVGNGAEAVQACTQRAYEVVLMDVQMPDMDGVEATRRIRASAAAGVQPYIIAVTANVLYEDRQSYTQAGMNAFLGKPYTMNDLEAALNEAMRARGISQVEQAPPPVAVASAAAPLLDRERHEEIKMLTNEAGPDVFEGLVRGLDKDLNAFAANLEGWVRQQDTTTLARAAHSLKGSSLSLGAQALGNMFAEIEKLAKAGHLGQAVREFTEGKKTAADTITALRQPDISA